MYFTSHLLTALDQRPSLVGRAIRDELIPILKERTEGGDVAAWEEISLHLLMREPGKARKLFWEERMGFRM